MRYRLRTLMIVLASLVTLPVLGQDKPDPGEVLYGEWEIVEMILHGKVQDFRGRPGGWFLFEPGGFIRSFNAEQREDAKNNRVIRKLAIQPCKIRPREIDIVFSKPLGNGRVIKASYELMDGKLRIVWSENPDERPTDFDEAAKAPRLTLFVLKKVN